MSVFGDFELVKEGDTAKRVFRVAGTNWVVDEDSVSSDWTSISENDDNASAISEQLVHGKQDSKTRRRRICKWRVKQKLRKHRHPKMPKEHVPSSMTSSCSASLTNESIEDSEARRRNRNKRRMSSGVIKMQVQKRARTITEMDACNVSLEWMGTCKKHRDLAFAWSFLCPAEISALHSIAAHPTVHEIHDRKAYLPYKHRVSRCEMQLRALEPALFSKLLSVMRLSDLQRWRKLRKRKDAVYPEIEYIDYDVSREGGDCYIEPHVDNKSAVTLIAMLSQSSDYVGGINCFRRASGLASHRQIKLEIGDVVMFRGERLLHWITNVTSGRRIILQIELSRT